MIDSLVSEAVDFSHGRPLPDGINLVAISREPLQQNLSSVGR